MDGSEFLVLQIPEPRDQDGLFPQHAATSDGEQQTVFSPREPPEGLRRPQRRSNARR